MAEPFTRASLAGAVDLSALRDRAQAANQSAPTSPAAPQSAQPHSAAPGATAAASNAGPGTIPVTSLVIDGGVENLRELLSLSDQIPVLVDFKTSVVPESAAMTSMLEKLILELDGRVILMRVDADAQPQILEAFQMRQGGVAVALIKGQPVPLISAGLDETEVRARLARLLEVAAQQGLTTRAVVSDAAAKPAEPQLPPRHQKAFELIDTGDYDGAIAEYEAALREMPTDVMAQAGLAQTSLLKRVHGLDFAAVLSSEPSADDASATHAALTKADAAVASGSAEFGCNLLLDRFAVQFGEREVLRQRLLEYFTILGNEDPVVIAARKRLTMLLY